MRNDRKVYGKDKIRISVNLVQCLIWVQKTCFILMRSTVIAAAGFIFAFFLNGLTQRLFPMRLTQEFFLLEFMTLTLPCALALVAATFLSLQKQGWNVWILLVGTVAVSIGAIATSELRADGGSMLNYTFGSLFHKCYFAAFIIFLIIGLFSGGIVLFLRQKNQCRNVATKTFKCAIGLLELFVISRIIGASVFQNSTALDNDFMSVALYAPLVLVGTYLLMRLLPTDKGTSADG